MGKTGFVVAAVLVLGACSQQGAVQVSEPGGAETMTTSDRSADVAADAAPEATATTVVAEPSEPSVSTTEVPAASGDEEPAVADPEPVVPVDAPAPDRLAYRPGLLAERVSTEDLEAAGFGPGWEFQGVETVPGSPAEPDATCGMGGDTPGHEAATWVLGGYELEISLVPVEEEDVQVLQAIADGCVEGQALGSISTPEIEGADLAVTVAWFPLAGATMAAADDVGVGVSLGISASVSFGDDVEQPDSPLEQPAFDGGAPTAKMLEDLTALVIERLRD